MRVRPAPATIWDIVQSTGNRKETGETAEGPENIAGALLIHSQASGYAKHAQLPTSLNPSSA